MNVVVVGGGGREHALVHALRRTAEVVCTPGNPGIPESVATPPERLDADLFVVGPEAPLVDGLADRLRDAGHLVFGPGADGARLEGSKTWMKEVLDAAGVPTARHAAFTDADEAASFLARQPAPYVVKTDGLAAGKGVFVTDDVDEATEDVRAKLAGRAFGDAGRRVVIEEGLTGPELSVLAVCDGRRAVPLSPAQDFKRVGNDGVGPNTGGMGAYSPVPLAGQDLIGTVMDRAVEPTLAHLRSLGIDYRGVLYAGVMLTPDGPKIIEFNVRFGDPEAQVVLPRFDGDLAGLLAEAAAGEIRTQPRFVPGAAVIVVASTEGYPVQPVTGDVISGVEEAGSMDGVTVFHAGTALDHEGRLVTAGGRVLGVTALAPTISEARRRAYEGIARISWRGMHYRNDIAADDKVEAKA